MSLWLPYAIQGGEALVIGLAGFLGAIPGIPAGDWKAAIALAVAKAFPKNLIGGFVNGSKNRLT